MNLTLMNLMFQTVCSKASKTFVNINHQVRFYPRWQHRTPRRVLSAEEYELQNEKSSKLVKKSTTNVSSVNSFTDGINSDLLHLHTRAEVSPKKKKIKKLKPEVIKKQSPTRDLLDTVIDVDGNLVYTKMKNHDQLISSVMTTVKSRKHREKEGLALIEGKRIILEALKSECIIKYLLFSRKSDLDDMKQYLPRTGIKLLKMPYKEMQIWSDLATTPGIMGILKVPKTEEYEPNLESLPVTIICDNIREPGNLGAVLRVAVGVGAEKVLLTKGCVDLWETKVLRSSMGAHFKIQIHAKMDWPSITPLLGDSSHVLIADNRIVKESESFDGANYTDVKSLVESIPVVPYHNLNFSKMKSIVLIVGGETEGISTDSYKIARQFKGARVNIPLKNGLDSLNTGTALGIISFEIMRQLVNKNDEETDSYVKISSN